MRAPRVALTSLNLLSALSLRHSVRPACNVISIWGAQIPSKMPQKAGYLANRAKFDSVGPMETSEYLSRT